MNGAVQVHSEGDAVVVRVPLKVRKRGSQGRKLMLAGADPTRSVIRRDHAPILKALGRAYRWKRMLESGEFASITDLARSERINQAYVRRILRLTLLSPEITERVLGASCDHRPLEQLLKTSSDVWAEQSGQLVGAQCPFASKTESGEAAVGSRLQPDKRTCLSAVRRSVLRQERTRTGRRCDAPS
jgi:hypothetical protein